MRQTISFLFLLFSYHSFSQLTPPGLGSNTKMNLWFAVGMDQKLDSVGKFSSMTYFGVAGQSSVENTNVFERLGIFVLNEEVKFKFKPGWNVTLAASYRRQNEFEKSYPYLLSEIGYKQEFRIYSRITKTWKKKWIPSIAFRQEYRKFYDPEFRDWKVSSSFRSRVKFQSEFKLNSSGRLRGVVGCESLFSSDFLKKMQKWQQFQYGETRLSAIFSFYSKNNKVSYNMGYMNDLLRVHGGNKSVHYITTGIIFKNLF